MSAYLELELAAALALQEQAKLHSLQKAISIPLATDYIETRCVNPDTVNMVTSDFSRAASIKLAGHQRRILNRVLSIDPFTGLFPYRTVVYSAPKKSGKTSISAFVGAWFAKYIEPPNAIMVLGNKQDQAADRAMAFMTPTLILEGAKPVKNILRMSNGTIIRALPNEPSSESGGSYGLTLWTELWGFTTARDRQMWAELMPVNTRKNSMRWVETYAGYEDSSDLLLSLFLQVFTDISERALQKGAEPVPGLEDILTTDVDGKPIPACYHVPKLGLFYYNDHEHRMDWQTGANSESYYAEVSVGLLQTDITRLVHNRWQATQNQFVTDEQAAGAFDRGADLPKARPGVFAIDASKSSAGTALYGSFEDYSLERFRCSYAGVWYPRKGEIDIESTLFPIILDLWSKGLILRREVDSLTAAEKDLVEKEGAIAVEIHYDGFQMAQVAINLRKKHKLMMKEFPQSTERLKADTFLQGLYQSHRVDIPDTVDMRAHLNAAKAAVEPDRSGDTTRVRIVRGEGEHSKPNDLIVAQSMSSWRLSQRPRRPKFLPLGQGVATGW